MAAGCSMSTGAARDQHLGSLPRCNDNVMLHEDSLHRSRCDPALRCAPLDDDNPSRCRWWRAIVGLIVGLIVGKWPSALPRNAARPRWLLRLRTTLAPRTL